MKKKFLKSVTSIALDFLTSTLKGFANVVGAFLAAVCLGYFFVATEPQFNWTKNETVKNITETIGQMRILMDTDSLENNSNRM